jgi:hypothetical protein
MCRNQISRAPFSTTSARADNFQFYQAGMNTRPPERLELESESSHALDQNEFALLYQRQFCS